MPDAVPAFRVIEDRYRDEAEEDSELIALLLEGRTVFLPEATNATVTTLYSRVLSRHGRKLRRRARAIEGTPGFVVWLEPAEADVTSGAPS